jgi:hypothetical protein
VPYQSIGVLSNSKHFDKGSGISIKVGVTMRIVVVIGEKWVSLETTLPFETTGGFIVTPSRIKALEFFEEWRWDVFFPELARRRNTLDCQGESVLMLSIRLG